MRKEVFFKIKAIEEFRQKALAWANGFNAFLYLSGNNHQNRFGVFPNLLAVDTASSFSSTTNNSFEKLYEFSKEKKDFLFGHLSYDLKNEIEKLTSRHKDEIGFPSAFFFQPRHLIYFFKDEVSISSFDQPEEIYKAITETHLPQETAYVKPEIKTRISKQAYLEKVEKIRNHLLEGDIYELNFCMEFFAEQALINPISVFQKLNSLSPMPFASLYKLEHKYLICCSPERFLKKSGSRIISQPIKGTARRDVDPKKDEQIKEELQNSEKERAENMMIVDLVRNDLAHSSKPGTTKVEEFFGIYTYNQVHQMISTISSELKDGLAFTEAIKNAFPMGSMTGAPKIKAMELIETYEESRRGLFSGAVGYITPEQDFDFNVVIRSVLYNAATKYLSFQTGSAITYDSVAEKEYEECLLKAKAILQVLNGD